MRRGNRERVPQLLERPVLGQTVLEEPDCLDGEGVGRACSPGAEKASERAEKDEEVPEERGDLAWTSADRGSAPGEHGGLSLGRRDSRYVERPDDETGSPEESREDRVPSSSGEEQVTGRVLTQIDVPDLERCRILVGVPLTGMDDEDVPSPDAPFTDSAPVDSFASGEEGDLREAMRVRRAAPVHPYPFGAERWATRTEDVLVEDQVHAPS